METEIKNLHPNKKGKLAKDQDDKLVLVNDDGKVYSTNEAILVVWQLCNGDKSVSDLSTTLKNKQTSENFEKGFISLIQKLHNAQLIEFVS